MEINLTGSVRNDFTFIATAPHYLLLVYKFQETESLICSELNILSLTFLLF